MGIFSLRGRVKTFAITFAGVTLLVQQTKAAIFRVDFSGYFEDRYQNPFDPATYQYYSNPVVGSLTYDTATPASSTDYASATYNNAVTSYSFKSTDFTPYYGTDTVSSANFPGSSSIRTQGGASYYGMATIQVNPRFGSVLSVSMTYPSGSFSSPDIAQINLSAPTSSEYPPTIFFGLACTQYAPCGPAGEGHLTAFTVTPVSNPSMPPAAPSTKELAQLSGSAYDDRNNTRFSQIAETDAASTPGFRGVAYEDGDEIVVSFRGTEPGASGLKDDVADRSFVTGTPSVSLALYTAEAVEFLAKVHADHPGADITLTGHSLGGAIAEMLGDYSNFTTKTFNAPGPADVEGKLNQYLSLATGLSGKTDRSVTSYRTWGDAISAAGTHSDDDAHVVTLSALTGHDDKQLKTLSGALQAHSLSTVIASLDLGSQELSGVVGPLYPLNIVNGAIVAGLLVLSFAVDPLVVIGIDPPPSGGYSFLVDGSSPPLDAVLFPEYDGIDHYLLSTFADGSWSSAIIVKPLQWLRFQDSTFGFKLYAVDANSNAVDFKDALLFDATFQRDGTVNATIEGLPSVGSSAVPEPLGWTTTIIGFYFVGSARRKRRRLLRNGNTENDHQRDDSGNQNFASCPFFIPQ